MTPNTFEAYTATSNDHDIINPWGGYPGFTSIIVEDNNRAGENTWLAGLSCDFSSLGINGLSAFSTFTDSSTPKTGPHASPSQNKLDFTVDYQFQKLLDELWIRLRTAFITRDKSMGGQDMQDYRVIVNYRIPFKSLTANGKSYKLAIVAKADVDVRPASLDENAGHTIAMRGIIAPDIYIIRGCFQNGREVMDRRTAHGCRRIKRTMPSFLLNLDRRSCRGAAMAVSRGGDTVNTIG